MLSVIVLLRNVVAALRELALRCIGKGEGIRFASVVVAVVVVVVAIARGSFVVFGRFDVLTWYLLVEYACCRF